MRKMLVWKGKKGLELTKLEQRVGWEVGKDMGKVCVSERERLEKCLQKTGRGED